MPRGPTKAALERRILQLEYAETSIRHDRDCLAVELDRVKKTRLLEERGRLMQAMAEMGMAMAKVAVPEVF